MSETGLIFNITIANKPYKAAKFMFGYMVWQKGDEVISLYYPGTILYNTIKNKVEAK